MDQFDFMRHCDFCKRSGWLDSIGESLSVIAFASVVASSDTIQVEDLPNQVFHKHGFGAAAM